MSRASSSMSTSGNTGTARRPRPRPHPLIIYLPPSHPQAPKLGTYLFPPARPSNKQKKRTPMYHHISPVVYTKRPTDNISAPYLSRPSASHTFPLPLHIFVAIVFPSSSFVLLSSSLASIRGYMCLRLHTSLRFRFMSFPLGIITVHVQLQLYLSVSIPASSNQHFPGAEMTSCVTD